MPAPFSPRLDVLPPPQRRLWLELAAIPQDFHLYGGTALALYLGHRESVHFDFFGSRPLDPTAPTLEIPLLSDAEVVQREPDTLSCLLDWGGPVKLSFFGVPNLPRLRPPAISRDNGLPIASLSDLAGTKAAVVQMRAEARDYLDMHALLIDGRVDLPTALGCALALYGAHFNPQSTLKALATSRTATCRLSRRQRRNICDALPEKSTWTNSLSWPRFPLRMARPDNESHPAKRRNAGAGASPCLVRAA